MKTFVTLNIPYTAKRDGETNEDAFLRIVDTWMGEYLNSFEEFTCETLGNWVLKYDKRFEKGTFPVAWEEDENGNITDYYIYYYRGRQKWMKHETVEF